MRIIGDITSERLRIVRAADRIFDEELRRAELYNSVWQSFAVLLPVSTVGVMGDERTYENVLGLRAVTSVDGMTADWYPFPAEVLGRISNRIITTLERVASATPEQKRALFLVLSQRI